MASGQQALVIKNNWLWIFLPNKWSYLFRSEKYAPMRMCYLNWIVMILSILFMVLVPNLGSVVDRFYYISWIWSFYIGLYMMLRPDTWVPQKPEEVNSMNEQYNNEKKESYKYNKYTMIIVWCVSMLGLALKAFYK